MSTESINAVVNVVEEFIKSEHAAEDVSLLAKSALSVIWGISPAKVESDEANRMADDIMSLSIYDNDESMKRACATVAHRWENTMPAASGIV